MGRRADDLGPVARRAQRGTEDASRVSGRHEAARRVGGRPGSRARGHRSQAHPSVRGRAFGARRLESDDRPQARVDPVVLPPPRRSRRAGGQPGGSRRDPKARQVPPARAEGGGDVSAARLDPRLDSARAARPRHLRAGLRHWPAGGGADQPGHGRRGLRRRGAARAREGRQGAGRTGWRARLAWRSTPTSSGGGHSWRARATWASAPSSCRRAAAGSGPATSAGACGPGRAAQGRRPARRHTRFATPMRPISWRAGRIFGRSRSCSAMRRSALRRHTLK